MADRREAAGAGEAARRGTAEGAARVVLAVIATQQLLMAYDSTAMNVAVSDIVTDLDTTLTGVQSAISLYALVMAALMITGSKLGSRVGHLRMFTLGATLYGCGALVTALSPGLPVMLLGWSLLEGIGAALVFPAILSIATLAFTGAARTRALTLVGAAAGVGAALGPLLGGVITRYLSWRVSFLLETVVTAVAVILISRQRIPRPKAVRQPSFDILGAVLSALGFGLIVLGTLLASRYGLLTTRTDVVLSGRTVLGEGAVSPTVVFGLAGVVVLALFAWWEGHRIRTGRDPLVRPAVLRNRTTRVGSLSLGLQFLVLAGVFFLVPVFVQTTLGYDALESGLTLLPATVMLVLGAASGTRAVGRGRTTRKPLILVGFLLIAAGAVMTVFAFEPVSSGLKIAPGLAVAGLGLGLCTLLPDLVQSSAAEDRVSDVAGLSRSFSYLGQSLGIALAGALMIGVLLNTMLASARTSTALTSSQKATVEHALEHSVQATAVSDQQLRAELGRRGITGPPADELVRINAQAREDGLTAAMAAMGVFALSGAALATRLPRTARNPAPAREQRRHA
ncbi:MFS transporter [Streptomyces sp. NPDC047117]|uniref:MFS transporter n=1 Tax=Streptomyces sp. NPDC047117 TaxID=3155379 RepID=UPI0033EC2B47